MKKEIKVFISYSWGDGQEHGDRVHSFTDYLRGKGFYAQIDKMLSQDETATDFKKMMHRAMQGHDKVIVVLSEEYKKRADEFRGGVGDEYALLLNDIEKNPKKYILFSFDERRDDYIPFGLTGRDVVSSATEGWENRLFAKLKDEPEYVFAEVASEMPVVVPIIATEFNTKAKPESLQITLDARPGNSLQTMGVYRHVEFDCAINVTNTGEAAVTNLSVELKYHKYLEDKIYDHHVIGDDVVITEEVSKIFTQQSKQIFKFKLKFRSDIIHQTIQSQIKVTLYTDHGNIEKIFPVTELNLRDMYGNPVNLSLDTFGF